MKTGKRLLSLLLALILIVGLFPGQALAQDPDEGSITPVEEPEPSPAQEPGPAPGEEPEPSPAQEPQPTPAATEKPLEEDVPILPADPDFPGDASEDGPEGGEIEALPPEDGAESLIVFVSGVVLASELEENSSLQLTGDTELKMDVARTLEYISGSHALTITGSGLLTVNNSNNDFDSITTAINVGSLVSSVSMDIRAPHGSGIVSAQDITITGGVTVNVSSALVAISAENNIEISVSALAVNSGFDGLNNSKGTISVSANSLVIEAGQDAIEAYRGAVTVNVSGTGIVKSTFHDTTGFYTGGRGITASDDISLGGGGTLTINSPHTCLLTQGSLRDTGLSLDLTSTENRAISTEGSVTVTGASLLKVSSGNIGIDATDSIYISVAALTVNSDEDGLYSYEGMISVSADRLAIEAGQDAIDARSGAVTVNVSGTGTVTSTFHDTSGFYTGGRGIMASGDINLGGGGTLTINTPKSCILTQGSLRDTELSLDLTSTEYRGISTEGSVTITGASLLKVSSDGGGISATDSINISVATLTINSKGDGLCSYEGLISVSAHSLAIEAGVDIIEAHGGTVTVNVGGTGTLISTFLDTSGFYTGGFGITASDDISLGGGGTLTINCPRTCILTPGSLKDTGVSLDLTSTEYKGISAEGSVTITGASLLKVSSDDTGIDAADSIYISVSTLRINSEGDGLHSSEGAINVSAYILAIEAGLDAIEANLDAVTLTVSGTGTLTSSYRTFPGEPTPYGYGIFSGGNIHLSGGGTLTASCFNDCVHASGSVTASNVSLDLKSTGNSGIDSNSAITVNNAASLKVKSKGVAIYTFSNDINIAATVVNIDAEGNCIYAREGTVTLNAINSGILESKYGYGVFASGEIRLGGYLKITSENNCICSSSDSVIGTNASLDLLSYDASCLYACQDLSVTGAALLKAYTKYSAIISRGDVNIEANTISIDAGWYGMDAYGIIGNAVSITAVSLTIDARKYAVKADGPSTLNLSGTGIFKSSGGEFAVFASGGITIREPAQICFPEGGHLRDDGRTIVDAGGNPAHYAEIGIPLTGTLTIEGGATEYAYGETISVISSGLPPATEYMWQVSEDGENWTDQGPGEAQFYSDSVIRIKRDAGISTSVVYYRLRATCPNYVGEIYSPVVHVKQAFKVRYYPNGGSGSMDNVGTWKHAGETFTLHQNTFTPPERKSFKAWRIDGVEYQPGDTITISGDTYIYAVWQTSEWLIQFSPGSGSGASGSMAPMTVPCGESFTLPPCSFTPPEGKTFSRWWLGGNLYYAPGDSFTPNSNEVVVAEWRSNRTVVGFDPNGGRGSMNPVSLTPEQAAAWTVPECTYNPPEDCLFSKWQLINDTTGESMDVMPGDTVTLNGFYYTLKAIWMLKPSFEVSFNANGHGTAPLPQSVMQDHYAMDPGPLSAEGYTFLGWYTEAAGTNRFDFTATKITGPTTLYAKWMDQITAIEISDFVFPEAGMRSVPSARITTGNRAYVCTGIEWRWPTSNSSYGYAVSYTPMTFEPSTEYTAVITLETVRDYRFDTGEAPERVTINGESVNVDLTRSGYVSDTKYQLYTVPVLTEDLIPIDEAHFPDDAFRAILRGRSYDLNQDGYFSRSEIGVITELNLSQENIASLEGIGCLSELKTLNAVDNALTTLDLSDNWMLETVYCSLNANLTELLLPKSAWLKWLQCYGCALTGLDVRGCTYLSYAAATTPTISANGKTATYTYMVGGVKTAEMILDASTPLYDSYVNYARVRFDPGVGTGYMSSVMAEKTAYYTLPSNGFTAPEDMYFNGWKLGDKVYNAGATMERLFAADENEVIFVAQWKSKKVLSITPPDANKQIVSGGFPVEFTFSGEQILTGSKWYSSYNTSTHTAGEIATSLIANRTYYGMVLFPTGITANRLAQEINGGTFVLRDAELVDIVSVGSGTTARGALIVSLKPRTITVSFLNGGGSGFMAPETGLYPGSSYKLPASTFTAPADMVFDRWSLGAAGTSITLTQDTPLIARWRVADGAIPIDEAHFPDEDFRNYVSDTLDTNHGGWLLPSEIEAAQGITMEEDHDVSSLEGIQYLTELTYILVDSNRHLTSADLRANTALTGVEMWGNGLTEINLEGLHELTGLYVDNNALTELDLKGLAALYQLDCYANRITELDLTDCPLLVDAVVNGQRTETAAYVQYKNGSNFLRVDAATVLITDKGIPVDEEHFPDGVFRSLVSLHFDLDGNGYLKPAEIEAITQIGGDFTGAAIADLRGVEYFTYLETLDVSGNELTELDLRCNTALTSANLRGNALFSLKLTGLTALEQLDCSRNPLPALDLTGLTGLNNLYCVDLGLTQLDLTGAPNLEYLSILGNPELSSLDLRSAPKLLQAVQEGSKEDYTDEGYDGWIYHVETYWLLIDKTTEPIGDLPAITIQPEDAAVRITNMASFTVGAEGEGGCAG